MWYSWKCNWVLQLVSQAAVVYIFKQVTQKASAAQNCNVE